MKPRQLLLIEGGIVLVAVIVLYAIVGWPFGGDAGAGDRPPASGRLGGSVPSATATPAPTEAGASPTPSSALASGCAPEVDESFLSANQIVAYYGNPYAETLGILGQHEPAEVARLLNEHAARLDDLNGIRGVQPAFHMVYAVAQPHETDNGLYLLYVDPETTQEYIDVACENRMFMFLDIQGGRSNIADELEKVLPYLRQTNVHIALDPEFTMHGDEIPGQAIGHLDASEINEAQRIINDFVAANNLPDKVLVVHQFDESMITNKPDIGRYPHVRLVIDMDGFGGKEAKMRKYGIFAQPAEHGGIKVFFEQDTPPMTDEEIESLDPDLIIFQ